MTLPSFMQTSLLIPTVQEEQTFLVYQPKGFSLKSRVGYFIIIITFCVCKCVYMCMCMFRICSIHVCEWVFYVCVCTCMGPDVCMSWYTCEGQRITSVMGHSLPYCLRQNRTCQAGWPISFRTFSCLGLPSFHSSTGITGMNYLVWAYMWSGILIWLFLLWWEVLYALSRVPIPRGRNSQKLVERKSKALVNSWHSYLLPGYFLHHGPDGILGCECGWGGMPT